MKRLRHYKKNRSQKDHTQEINLKQSVPSSDTKIENKIWLLNYQVCIRVQQNILNAENKRDKIFVD